MQPWCRISMHCTVYGSHDLAGRGEIVGLRDEVKEHQQAEDEKELRGPIMRMRCEKLKNR